MRKPLLAILTLMLTACGTSPESLSVLGSFPTQTQPHNLVRKNFQAKWVLRNRPTFIPGEIVVEMKDGFQTKALPMTTFRAKSKKSLRIENRQFDLIRLQNPQETPKVMADLQRNPQIKSVSLNPRYVPLGGAPVTMSQADSDGPNDSLVGLQWSLDKLEIFPAWKISSGSPNILVAVVDSGIDYQHPDLQGQIINGPDFMPSNSMDDASPDSQDQDPMDELGHGTHVAGLIGAIPNNQRGVAGIAPQVKILNLKALNAQGWGSAFAIAQAVTQAADKGARIINMSLGSKEASKPIELAVQYALKKGCLVIAAAGNEFTHTSFPAAYPGVLAVGAVDQDDKLATFSNHDERINVMAPGVDIMSTTPTFATESMIANAIDPNYAVMSGTSMATPIVSAQAALLLSKNPQLTAEEIKQLIQSTAKKVGDPTIFGHGRIQILESLRRLEQNSPAPVAPPAAVVAQRVRR